MQKTVWELARPLGHMYTAYGCQKKAGSLGARDAEVTLFFLGTLGPGPAGFRGSLRQRQDVHRAPSRLALPWARGVQG